MVESFLTGDEARMFGRCLWRHCVVRPPLRPFPGWRNEISAIRHVVGSLSRAVYWA